MPLCAHSGTRRRYPLGNAGPVLTHHQGICGIPLRHAIPYPACGCTIGSANVFG